jgi:hypothetical protein
LKKTGEFMSDMANFFLEEVVDAEHKRHLFHNGKMNDQDAFEQGFLSPDGASTGLAGLPTDYIGGLSPECVDAELASAESMLDGRSPFRFSAETTDCDTAPYVLSQEEEQNYFRKILKKKYSDKYAADMLCELAASGWDRTKAYNTDVLKSFIAGVKNDYPKAYEALGYLMYHLYGSVLTGSSGVNSTAVKLAQERVNPTCNVCLQEMVARTGAYGKFYFCANKCAGQGTVSDKYWQEFRVK